LTSKKDEDPDYFDQWLLLIVLSLIVIGLIMVMSSSMHYAQKNFNGNAFYFIERHLIYLLFAFVVSFFILKCPILFWQKYGGYCFLLGILLLIAVLFIGKTVNGSQRWLSLGLVTFQVSELIKLIVIIYLSGYLVRRTYEVQYQFIGFFKPLLLLTLVSLLLLLEPDFGAAVVILATSFAMLFLGGAKLWQFIGFVCVALFALTGLAVMQPYRLQRLLTFMEPWADPFGSGYQLTQSLIAFGRGHIFGEGLGNSLQKLAYLPEAHTDFILAVLAEEQGLIGVTLIILLYLLFFFRAMGIGRTALLLSKPYSAYLAYGIGFSLTFQAIINIGVTSGALPTKGLTLPFISYGGNSLLMSLVSVALLLRIDYENRLVKHGYYPSSYFEMKGAI
jgi:cell division protein FtsW